MYRAGASAVGAASAALRHPRRDPKGYMFDTTSLCFDVLNYIISYYDILLTI